MQLGDCEAIARVRKISRDPDGINFYLLDSNFLANKFIPLGSVKDVKEKARVHACHKWWHEIDRQVKAEKAFLYVPVTCPHEWNQCLSPG